MTRMRTKKTERDEFLSKNQGHAIKYRKRLQEDAEVEQELKEYTNTNGDDNRVLPEEQRTYP